ncbi:MAG: 16S rRNA (guanine(527)-N(7))-methyltransferase RsmG [Nitrosomonas sp.]|nr:16S rRNA (guanine(527)-N(7))-methyltransferase RsmG [Nitrosomonas sp.]
MDLKALLIDGLAKMPALPADQSLLEKQLLQYVMLVVKWNATHNLTAVKTPEAMITRHLLDSLSVLPYISGPSVVDVGSGGGFPGIPIALARPEWQITLVESNGKKAVFLKQVALELNLPNVLVVHQRVEKTANQGEINTVISRAFSSLSRFTQLAGVLCEKNPESCRLVAMKGDFPDLELMQLPPEFAVEQIIPVVVPGLKAKRHLIVMKCNQCAQ